MTLRRSTILLLAAFGLGLLVACGGVSPGPVDSDAPADFTTTESGLKYRIRRKSEGTHPSATSTVKVHYKGWLDDGTEFDSSYARESPAVFPLTGVIPAWTEGLQLVGSGGMIELEAPPELGYGPRGFPPSIPPNAQLHFLVELLEVLPSSGQPPKRSEEKPAAKPADDKPPEGKPSGIKPSEPQPSDDKSPEGKTPDEKPGDAKPAETKPSDEKSGAGKSSEAKP